MDGLFTRSLVSDLEEITQVQVVHFDGEEHRGESWLDMAAVVESALVITLTTKELVVPVVVRVRRWVKTRRSERERQERRAVILGPGGEVLETITVTDHKGEE